MVTGCDNKSKNCEEVAVTNGERRSFTPLDAMVCVVREYAQHGIAVRYEDIVDDTRIQGLAQSRSSVINCLCRRSCAMANVVRRNATVV